MDYPDSTYGIECSGGPALHDLAYSRLYGMPDTGGGVRLLQQHSASGMEGAPDSFVVDPGVGWLFYVTAVDSSGKESCASNTVYIPGSVTGVEPRLGGDPVLTVDTYDIHGRPVHGVPRASGVYYRVIRHRSGLVSRKRVVVLK